MLRKLEIRDAQYMLEWMHDDAINKRYKRDFANFGIKEVTEFIDTSFSDDNKHFAVVDDKDEYMGTISLKNISPYNKNAECTYVFRSKVSGEQIMEALTQIKEYAFNNMELAEIYAHVFEDDDVNVRYLTQKGFVKGGTYVGKYLLRGVYRNLCWYTASNSSVIKDAEKHEMIRFSERGDKRGHLVVIEQLKDVPFEIKRLFYIYGSEEDVIRGQHANRKSEFVLVNVSGTSKVSVDDGEEEKIYVLDQPHTGVYLPRMVWKEMYDFSPDSVLLVISSEVYDPEEYIRDYDEFKRELGKKGDKNGK